MRTRSMTMHLPKQSTKFQDEVFYPGANNKYTAGRKIDPVDFGYNPYNRQNLSFQPRGVAKLPDKSDFIEDSNLKYVDYETSSSDSDEDSPDDEYTDDSSDLSSDEEYIDEETSDDESSDDEYTNEESSDETINRSDTEYWSADDF